MKKILHRTLAWGLAIALTTGLVPGAGLGGSSSSGTLSSLGLETADAATTTTEDSPKVETKTQKQIVEFLEEHPTGDTYFDQNGNMLEDYKIEYDESPVLKAPYSAGTLKRDVLVKALNTVRFIRYIAGLSSDVYLYDPYTEFAQSAALINYVNGKASHNPTVPSGMDETLGAFGVHGSADSNIDRTSWKNNSLKSSIIYAWMYDSDSSNIKTLGHRRWILNPSLVMTGFGSVTGSKGTCNTMYIRNNERNDLETGAVCWPTKNTPTSLFASDSAWSISVGEEVNAQTAVVSVLRMSDYKTWIFSSVSSKGDFYVNNQAYGQEGCIIFRPEGLGEIKAGDKFSIYVSYNKKSISYEVSFFDLEHYYSPEAATITSLSIGPTDQPSIEWSEVKGADAYDVYRKSAGGSWKLISADLDEPYFDDAYATAGIKYYYRIVAKRTVNGLEYEADPSKSKTITTPLAKPVIKTYQAYSSGTNKLAWKKVSKATGYKVYRRVAGKSSWSLIGTTKAASYTDKKASRGVKYEYRVRAYRTNYKNTVYSSYSAKRTIRTRY